MTADQIAAEAAHILCGNVIHAKDKDWATGIIKAAIEKAYQQGRDDLADERLIDGAAHASELSKEDYDNLVRDAMRCRHQQAHASEPRPCTCHPDDNPPKPCAEKYALSECKASASEPDWKKMYRDTQEQFNKMEVRAQKAENALTAHASEQRCLVCDTKLDCPQCRSQRPTDPWPTDPYVEYCKDEPQL